MDAEDDNWDHKVLVNGEGHYSLWPAFKAAPAGWTAVGPVGDRTTCLEWVEAQAKTAAGTAKDLPKPG